MRYVGVPASHCQATYGPDVVIRKSSGNQVACVAGSRRLVPPRYARVAWSGNDPNAGSGIEKEPHSSRTLQVALTARRSAVALNAPGVAVDPNTILSVAPHVSPTASNGDTWATPQFWTTKPPPRTTDAGKSSKATAVAHVNVSTKFIVLVKDREKLSRVCSRACLHACTARRLRGSHVIDAMRNATVVNLNCRM